MNSLLPSESFTKESNTTSFYPLGYAIVLLLTQLFNITALIGQLEIIFVATFSCVLNKSFQSLLTTALPQNKICILLISFSIDTLLTYTLRLYIYILFYYIFFKCVQTILVVFKKEGRTNFVLFKIKMLFFLASYNLPSKFFALV